jgi:hypothetical protein
LATGASCPPSLTTSGCLAAPGCDDMRVQTRLEDLQPVLKPLVRVYRHCFMTSRYPLVFCAVYPNTLFYLTLFLAAVRNATWRGFLPPMSLCLYQFKANGGNARPALCCTIPLSVHALRLPLWRGATKMARLLLYLRPWRGWFVCCPCSTLTWMLALRGGFASSTQRVRAAMRWRCADSLPAPHCAVPPHVALLLPLPFFCTWHVTGHGTRRRRRTCSPFYCVRGL